jgi:hypothetical protein
MLIHRGELQIPPVGKNAEDQNHSPDDDLRYLRYPCHNQTVHPFMLRDLQLGAPARQQVEARLRPLRRIVDRTAV